VLPIAKRASDIAISPDGQVLAAIEARNGRRESAGKLTFWELATGKVIQTIKGEKVPRRSWRASLAFSADSQVLAVANPQNVWLWDVDTGQLHLELKDTGYGVALSPDGKTVASGSREGKVMLWDVGNGNLKLTLSGHTIKKETMRISLLEFSPDSQLLVSSPPFLSEDPVDEGAKLWDLTTGKLLRTFSEAVTEVAFTGDGRSIATGDRAGVVRLRDTATGKLYRTFEQRIGRVACAAFSPNGQMLATGGYQELSYILYPRPMEPDNTIKFWDVATGNLHKTLNGYERPANALVFSSDGKKLASIGLSLKVWDLESGKEQLIHAPTSHAALVYEPVSFTPDNGKVAARVRSGMNIWDVATGKTELLSWPKALKWPRYSGVFRPDGSKLVFRGENTIRLWDLKTNEVQDIAEAKGTTRSIALSPDGKLLAFATELTKVILWELASKQARFTIETGIVPRRTGDIGRVVFNPDGTILAVALGNSGLQLWDVGQGRLVRSLDMRTIEHQINYAVFSPDGKILATCGKDNAIARLWETKTGKLIRTIRSDNHKSGKTSQQDRDVEQAN
jgi:WD40 repeat protein